MSSKTNTKNCITLSGSAKIVSEFFYYGLNYILYQRGIYPSEEFGFKKQYGLSLYIIEKQEISSYLKTILTQIKTWLEKGEIQRLVLVINAVPSQEVLERWDFQIDNSQAVNDKLNENKKEAESKGEQPKNIDTKATMGEKDLKIIQREMQDVLRQITACVSFLPMLDQQCSFDIIVHTNKDCELPKEWSDTSPHIIDNCQEVKLKSFSTSVHKVQAAVSYKHNQL